MASDTIADSRRSARQPGSGCTPPSPPSTTGSRRPTSPPRCASPRRRARPTPAWPTPPTGRTFVAWCGERGATPLPCPPGLLCGYLSALAEAGLRASTISRRASGIAHVHRLNGHEPPTNSEAVKQVLRGIRRTLGTARQAKTPATHDLIARMMAACPATG